MDRSLSPRIYANLCTWLCLTMLGCTMHEDPGLVNTRLLQYQQKIHQDITETRTIMTEATAEALGTARSAKEAATASQQAIQDLAKQLDELKAKGPAIQKNTKELVVLNDKVKKLEGAVDLIRTKTGHEASDSLYVQVRVPPAPVNALSKKDDIRDLNRALMLAGLDLHTGDQFTRTTTQSIKDFQHHEHLKETGVYDALTEGRLRAILTSAGAEPSGPDIAQPVPAPSPVSKPAASQRSNDKDKPGTEGTAAKESPLIEKATAPSPAKGAAKEPQTDLSGLTPGTAGIKSGQKLEKIPEKNQKPNGKDGGKQQ